MAADNHQILTLFEDGSADLMNAAYLGEYSAIVIDAISVAFSRLLPSLLPPTEHPVDEADLYKKFKVEHDRRTEQATGFFQAGGILVVRMHPETDIVWWGGPMSQELDRFGIGAWWKGQIELDWVTDTYPGDGHSVEILQPDHPFAAVIGSGPEYTARFAYDIDAYGKGTVLARNRSGDAIAAEFDISPGKIICVQSGCDAEVLGATLRTHLDDIRGSDTEILLPEEDEL